MIRFLEKNQKKIKPVETAVVVPVVPKKPKTNLITAVPSHKVKRLVISLQNSEDEDNELCGDIFTKHFLSTNICLDSENYADAASPSSLFLKNSQKDEITKNYKNLATRLRALKALNKDNVSLTKDCSTQVELEATIPTDNQNTDVQGDNKKLEEIEETEKTPKKVIEEVAATEEKLKEPETLRIDYVIRPEFILGVIQERRQKKGFRILQWSNEYISPLCFRVNSASSSASRKTSQNINPNSIVCPYALIGRCDDKGCKYNHI
uniref:C3H1-type domain-containing protein n=1 Tax=Megaselia scalaris TaxID=36166 RepID=T1GY59_MEGSC